MNRKNVSKVVYFSISTFCSWQIFRSINVLLGTPGYFLNGNLQDASNLKLLFIVWGVFFTISERIVLKKLNNSKDSKTYFGMAYPFQMLQVLSILLGIIISLFLSIYRETN